MTTIYLASPYGFSPSTLPFLGELKRALRAAGHTVNDPWELPKSLSLALAEARAAQGEERVMRLQKVSRDIGEFNQVALEASDHLVAGLDGADIDSGTASEIGYAFARGKRIVGLRSDLRRTGENEGVMVNLQVQFWIEKSGGRIVQSVQELLKALTQRNPRR